MDPNQDNNGNGNDNASASEDTSPSSSLPQSPSSDDKYTFLFTSESVGEGHPDKICDQVSDAVLDAILQKDPLAKVSCQCVAKTGMILMCGDISTTSCVDFQRIARDTIEKIGYDGSVKGFDYKTCNILTSFDHHEVPSDLGLADRESLPAGDQGLMFGYATDETDECMPLTISLSHKLNARLATLRKSGVLDWARPDSKAQVTIEYGVELGATVPIRVHTVVISVQHNEHVTLEQLRLDLMEKVIKPVIPARYLDNDTIYHLQPSGKFIIGGPQGDAGLTGRKIIVDTYGGWGAHGGGAFSGKDGSHVVRCGSYAARWVAKSLVKAGLCRRCLVQLAYARGVAEPLSITVFSFGTSTKKNDELLNIIKHNFDLRPGKIVQDLGLQKPIFQQTAAYGHFGRPEFPWEQAKRLSF